MHQPSTVGQSWRSCKAHQLARGQGTGKEPQESHKKFLGESLSGAQQSKCKANQYTHAAMKSQLDARAPTVCGVVFLLLHHTAFHMSATAKHPFTCVCFRKTIFYVFDLAKHPYSPSKTQPTVQRNRKFPFQNSCLFLIDLEKFHTYFEYQSFIDIMHCKYLWVSGIAIHSPLVRSVFLI